MFPAVGSFHRRTHVYSEGTNNRKSISHFCTLPSHKCVCVRVCDSLGHDAEHRVVAADARADLFVVLLGVTHLVELRLKRNRHTKCHILCFRVSERFFKSFFFFYRSYM